MKDNSYGKIITFYSYKGGTGRSMALANVAWILANNGKRVLMLDWDLEAPGLHAYFYPFLKDKELKKSEGIIDFVIDFQIEAMTPSEPEAEVLKDWYKPHANILRYAAVLKNCKFDNGGLLDFIPAGRQRRSYANRVNSFNWQDFYKRLGGWDFLEAAKEKMQEMYDYILIDSRTGVSDTSGICTVQMPDILVVCFTLNNQSVEGAAAVANSVYEQRRESDLQVFPVPMRVDGAEQEKLDLRWERARRKFASFPAHIPPEDREQYWNDVAVPYVAYYAYEETLAVFVERYRRTPSLLEPMENLTRRLTQEKVERVPIHESLREEILAQYEGEGATRPGLKREQREQDKVFAEYLDRVERLLTDQRLRELKQRDYIRVETRTRTLAVLRQLNKARKRDLLRYLHEAALIKREDPDGKYQYPVIGLDGADLGEADLKNIDLSGDALYRVNAERASFRSANLSYTDLYGINLVGADLRDADLSSAYLKDANLSNAVLANALLTSADLRGANLTEADLSGVNLSGAEVTSQQLDACKSLAGATMPAGGMFRSRSRWILLAGAATITLLSTIVTLIILLVSGFE